MVYNIRRQSAKIFCKMFTDVQGLQDTVGFGGGGKAGLPPAAPTPNTAVHYTLPVLYIK